MNQRHHIRTGSQGRKPLSAHHPRPGKPPAIRRGCSYNNAHAQSHPPSQTTSRPNTAVKKLPGDDRPLRDDDSSDMSSFLQFCATCEKQIVTPGISILYCSEACRRKDVSNPYNLHAPHSPALCPSTTYFDYPSNDIVPQRSPTVLPPLSLAFADFPIDRDFAGEVDEAMSPLDRRGSEESQLWYRSDSESSLSHYSAARPPRGSRDGGHLPSLIHSTSSSYSTVGSMASYRPPPPRHSNPFSTSYSTTKSIDLVLPYHNNNASSSSSSSTSTTQWLTDASYKSSASTLTSLRVAEAGELSYERRKLDGTPKQRQIVKPGMDGSLKQLFSHDAIKASPRNV